MATEIDQVPEADPMAGASLPAAGLGRRLLDWRTALSFGVAVAILVLALTKAGIRWHAALDAMASANPLQCIPHATPCHSTY